ncbi:DUF5074 domain-containing protein [Phocaeicola sp.]|uniref:DUF5074 domain-containing protein n=1 Tax=Phocaeicola sp. TaxID=2773926 RepID=UPI0023C2FC47|nr:DUF5074 domain-containing protein [Phocaeicola sp.]MDE5677786.1 hypothetical protein [Phocaeicola sp.]
MKKNWYKQTLMVIALGVFTACSDDNDNVPEPPVNVPTETVGAYILNTGNYGGNDASIQYLDMEKGTVSTDLYAAANAESLGDLGQDLCLYGSKLYATVSGSSKIVIMDKNCKVIKSIPLTNDENQPISPRYMTAIDGNVYFTAYDGTVSRLDTLSMSITGSVKVGDHPEALTNANGKLYVNISGYGSGKSVAVVDIKTFTKTKDLEVILNPYTQCITADDGYVYVVSCGNYAGDSKKPESEWIYQSMQRIDPKTDEVESICPATYIANNGDNMYILYAEYYLPDTHKAVIYDLKTRKESPFINISSIPSPQSMNIDPVSGDVYISNAPYGSTSDLMIYDKDGNFKKKLSTGYFTSKVVFITNNQ